MPSQTLRRIKSPLVLLGLLQGCVCQAEGAPAILAAQDLMQDIRALQ